MMTTTPLPLAPLASTPLVLNVLNLLREEIALLEPGGRLPTECSLCEKYGVSRKTLRAALAHLEREALIRRVRGKGTYLTFGRRAMRLFRTRPRTFGVISSAAWLGEGSEEDFYPALLNGIFQASASHDAQLVVSARRKSGEVAEAAYRMAQEERVEGLLLIAVTDQELLADLARRGKPVVLVDHFSERAALDCVRVDSAAGSRLAVEHLIRSGRRRIAYLDHSDPEVNPERRRGYREVLEEHGIVFHPAWVTATPPTIAGGAQAAMRLQALPADERPTAALAFSEAMALGAMQAFLRFGRAVPREMGIVGMGGRRPIVTLGLPALSAVRFDSAELGRLAVRMLVERLEHPHRLPRKVMLPPHLDLQESTAAAPA